VTVETQGTECSEVWQRTKQSESPPNTSPRHEVDRAGQETTNALQVAHHAFSLRVQAASGNCPQNQFPTF
jgi:hypothetical protein